MIVFGGLPGTGKTTICRLLLRKFKATYIRIDTIAQAMIASGVGHIGPTGYAVATALAEANLI